MELRQLCWAWTVNLSLPHRKTRFQPSFLICEVGMIMPTVERCEDPVGRPLGFWAQSWGYGLLVLSRVVFQGQELPLFNPPVTLDIEDYHPHFTEGDTRH